MYFYYWNRCPIFQRAKLPWTYAAMAASVVALSGCAGGFSPDLVRTQISTEPTSAQCMLTGTQYARTIKTPAYVILPKEVAPVKILCNAAGHSTFEAQVQPVFNGTILYNVLALSLTGLVVDMMNGHASKYPQRVHMIMEPTSFATTAARDAWFSRYRDHIAKKYDQATGDLVDQCIIEADENGRDCAPESEVAQQRKSRALAILEAKRQSAHVRTSGTALSY